MVNCSFCSKELAREVFCNASHKVMFHRVKKAGKNLIKRIDSLHESGTAILTEKDPIKRNKLIKKELARPPLENPFCKHNAMKGLCKMGC